jgi:ribosomal protein S20
LARTPRKWTGARSPSGLKRVRSSERRHEILAPRRTAAKTLVKKALTVATTPADGQDPQAALAEAMSALDRAAKVGAIHRNAAARRKSRLARNVNQILGGTVVVAARGQTKTVGRAAAAKAAKARIAAGKADKAKGAQTAAGKARAALTKTTRAETSSSRAAEPARAASPRSTTATGRATTTKAAKATTTKAAAGKASATTTKAAKATTTKAAAGKASATKATGSSAARPKAAATKPGPTRKS